MGVMRRRFWTIGAMAISVLIVLLVCVLAQPYTPFSFLKGYSPRWIAKDRSLYVIQEQFNLIDELESEGFKCGALLALSNYMHASYFRESSQGTQHVVFTRDAGRTRVELIGFPKTHWDRIKAQFEL